MASSNLIIPTEVLRARLRYCPQTGEIAWLASTAMNVRAGDRAGSQRQDGYIRIGITFGGAKRQYLAHRIAWQMHYGVAPVGQIDHINHNRADNRIANLRLATQAENTRNSCRLRNNRSGVTGVYFDASNAAWVARIGKPQKRIGQSVDFFEAVCMRKSAERRYGYHLNHGAV